MKQRLVLALSLAGAAVLVAVGVIAFQFGRIDPSPPSLRDDPDDTIPGEILYTSGQSCVTRADASGDARQEICFSTLLYIGPFAWVDPNTIRVWWQGAIADVDLATGARTPVSTTGTAAEKFPIRPPVSPLGEWVIVDRGDIYVVNAAGQEKIASFDIGNTWLEPLLWSPDGEWLLLRWQPPRGRDAELWVISRDGSKRGTLATDVQGNWVAWTIEGVGATPSIEELFGTAAR